MDDMDYYEYEESKKRFTPSKIIKFLFKAVAFIIIAGTFFILLSRMYLMSIPAPFTELTWTDTVVDGYNQGTLRMELQEVYEPFDDDGKYHVSNTALAYRCYLKKIPSSYKGTVNTYIESIQLLSDISPKKRGDVQFTVRYNTRSTINYLMKLYSLKERPKGEQFIYILSDDKGNKYTEYTYAKGQKPMYEFRRVIFPMVDLSGIEKLYLDIYYVDDVRNSPPDSKEKTMHETFILYSKEYYRGITVYEKAGKTDLCFNEKPEYISKLN